MADYVPACDVHEHLTALPRITGVYRCEKCRRVVLLLTVCNDMAPIRDALNAAAKEDEGT